MSARTRPALVIPVAALAFALLAGGGSVVATAAAKIAAKNSVTSKSIKNNNVKSNDLKDGSVESVDVADGSLGAGDVQDGSLASADVKDDGLTGADIAESSLGTVPNATAVGGVQVTPLSVSLPSTSGAVPVLSALGAVLSLDCGATLGLVYSRGASGPPIMFTGVMEPDNAFVDALAPSESQVASMLDGQFTVAIVVPGGGSVTAAFAGVYELNANNGANDCFYRGTITRVP